MSELRCVSSEKVADRQMMDNTLAMDFGGFTGDERAETGIANPRYSPKIHFAFQLCWFREFGPSLRNKRKPHIPTRPIFLRRYHSLNPMLHAKQLYMKQRKTPAPL
jgi:hypothetical protein